MRNYIILLGLLALLMTTNPVNSEVTEPEVAYEQGQAAIMSKDWVEAVEAFKRAARERELRAAASYWQAYSHYQLKQKAQAKRLLERLIRTQEKSQWVDDAKMLLFEHGDSDELVNHQQAIDEELKLFALQQLMFNQPDKAIPKVKALLEQSESLRVKQNALQMLGLSESKAINDMFFDFIKKEKNHELQRTAIQMLSLRDDRESREKLEKLYESLRDKETKLAIIQGFIHHDDNRQLLKFLEQEKDPALSKELIQILGIKGEVATLKDMYKNTEGAERRAILEALALSGDAEYLYYVIDNETDQILRNQAIQSLIMVDDEHMGDYLARLYEKANDPSEKDIIASVFIATDVDPEVIRKILNKEQDEARKRQLLHSLMAMDEVTIMKKVYEEETDPMVKAEIIRHLGVMDATDELMKLYQDNPEEVDEQALFEALGMSSQKLDVDFLMDRFKTGDEKTKQGVLNALMMQSDTDTMLKLFKAEKDYEVKKQIIKMIGVTNPEALIEAIED
jgi:hypothetical protein